jgi:hypothetical protein
VPGEDLTAFAHGELSDAARASVSAHLLRCARCRAEVDGARSLLLRLRGLSLDAAPVASSPWRGSRGRAVAAAAFVGLVAATWALAPGRTPRTRPTPGPVVAVAPPAPPLDLAPLLAAQRPDGRWTAGGGEEARDEAATALALLAMAPNAKGRNERGDVARALASGTRWLLARQRSDGRVGPARPGSEDHAIATSALLALGEATGDGRVRSAADRAVRRLVRDESDADGPGSTSALRWSAHALSLARSLGRSRVDEPLRAVEDRLVARGERPEDAAPVAGTEAWTEGRTDGASLALRILRASRG